MCAMRKVRDDRYPELTIVRGDMFHGGVQEFAGESLLFKAPTPSLLRTSAGGNAAFPGFVEVCRIIPTREVKGGHIGTILFLPELGS